MRLLNSLSGRFLLLTAVFVMLAEILIFVPSIARFREDFLINRIERAHIASLALLADDMISGDLEGELLRNAGVYNVVLRRDASRQLVLSSLIQGAVGASYDLRDATAFDLIRDAMARLTNPAPSAIRVMGTPPQMGGQLIEVTLDSQELRSAMIDYGLRILFLSLVISVITAGLLFLAVQCYLVRPIKRVVGHMLSYAEAPEDTRRVIRPSAAVTELREAEESLQSMQTQLTGALRQKEHLAQLGSAVAKVSHDLRNILTSAQMFMDRIETSEDPAVKRLAPKLVTSISRAVNRCESTLAYGKAEEPAPTLTRFQLADIVNDVFENERLATAGSEVRFTIDLPPAMTVRADQEQLYRVIANLVRNARQAIIASGQPGTVHVSAEETDDGWLISISDTGPGMPRTARDNLFKPFQGRGSKGGAGLGLTISAELVRGHGGTLTLAATGEEGTTFHISLPRGDILSR